MYKQTLHDLISLPAIHGPEICTKSQGLNDFLYFHYLLLILFDLNEIKIKINDKNKIKASGKDHGSWTMLQTQYKHKKLGPFDKNCNFGQFDFWQFCKKGQLHQCITPSILTLEMCSWNFYKS